MRGGCVLVSAGWGAMVRWLLHPNRVRRNTRLASVLRVTTHADGDCLVFIGRRPMPLRRAPQPATAPLFEFPMLLRRRTAAALYAIVCTQLLQHAHAVYLSALPDVRRSRTLLITSTLYKYSVLICVHFTLKRLTARVSMRGSRSRRTQSQSMPHPPYLFRIQVRTYSSQPLGRQVPELTV